MTSSPKKRDIEQLNFTWDKGASTKTSLNDQISLEEYLDFIEELKPTLKQIKEVKLFTERFSLKSN